MWFHLKSWGTNARRLTDKPAAPWTPLHYKYLQHSSLSLRIKIGIVQILTSAPFLYAHADIFLVERMTLQHTCFIAIMKKERKPQTFQICGPPKIWLLICRIYFKAYWSQSQHLSLFMLKKHTSLLEYFEKVTTILKYCFGKSPHPWHEVFQRCVMAM